MDTQTSHPCACRTSHSKTMGINMELVSVAIAASTVLEGFPLEFGTWQQGFASFQPQEH
uniref:Uncharacterized protein n=1 Tax=Anguilla anguilla TaxID=7936 RepID=A0A0E9VEC9_ANGAN